MPARNKAKRKGRKAPTMAQKQARSKFKRMVRIAKEIRRKNPNIKFSDAMKQASRRA